MLLIYSCSGRGNNFEITVDISDTDNEYLYLAALTLSGQQIIDSVKPRKTGRYVFRGHADVPDFYVIYKQPANYINIIIKPGDKFTIVTNDAAFDENYQVRGSVDSRLIQQMVQKQINTMEKITEISNEYEENVGQPGFEEIKRRIDSLYVTVVEEHKEFSENLIRENPQSLVSLMALYQQLGTRTAVFDYKKDFSYYARVDSNLSVLYPRTEAVIDLNRRVSELRNIIRLEPGRKAPEIMLPDIEGNETSLSSLAGKYVLIVFWASWSDESMEVLKRITALYPQLKRSNMECYQVSLDKSKESWLAALQQISADGIHVCDFKFWDSPVTDSYYIENIPLLYIIDKDSNILFKEFEADEIPNLLNELTN